MFIVFTGFAALYATAQAGDHVFDELRFGVTGSIAGDGKNEDGVFPSVTLYFDPFGSDSATGFADRLLKPRLHIGGEIGTSDTAANVIYGGVNWTFDFTPKLFADIGFGGLLHDGILDHGDDGGPKFGCRALFREYAALGYRLDEKWSVLAQIEHASHADLCDGPNDGLTRVGMMVGYRF